MILTIDIKFIDHKEKFFSPTKSSSQNFFRLISSLENAKQFDYFAFADQDDIWNKKHLEKAIEKLSTGIYDGYSSSIITMQISQNIYTIGRNNENLYKIIY